MEKIWQNSKVLHSTAKYLHHPPPPTPPQIQNIQPSPAVIKLSRRQLAVCTNSSLLLLLTSQFQDQFCLPKARAQEQNLFTPENPQILDDNPIESHTTTEENPVNTSGATSPTEENPVETSGTTSPTEENQVEVSGTTNSTEENPVETSGTTSPTEENQVEVSGNANSTEENPVETSGTTSPTEENPVEGSGTTSPIEENPVETSSITTKDSLVENDSDSTTATTIDSCTDKVPTKRAFLELAAKTGRNFAVDNLIAELERENGRCPGTKNVAGTVGIIVRDPLKPPPKQKLVARNGKLVIDEEEIGKEPNGTEFLISTKDSPELDASTLVVGKVLEGMEVVERMSQVKTVQENTSSPYFRVAKLIGDKRAVVAERGFNRPYSKVVITNCGLMA